MKNQFSLKKPCANCPFRNDGRAIELQPGRREDILHEILSQRSATFPCHKTAHRPDGRNFDEDGNYAPTDVSVCPGAAAVARKFGRDLQIVQLGYRLGFISENHYDEAMSETMEPSDFDIDPKDVYL